MSLSLPIEGRESPSILWISWSPTLLTESWASYLWFPRQKVSYTIMFHVFKWNYIIVTKVDHENLGNKLYHGF